MSSQYYFFDTSAIAKLYTTEKASHIVLDIFNDRSNLIMYSDLAYTETVSALSKKRNRNLISDNDLNEAVTSFKTTFLTNPIERLMPINIGDVMDKTLDILLETHDLKNKGRNDIEYLKSLDCIQMTSWLEYAKTLRVNFVTGDAKFARVVDAYIQDRGLGLEVINVSDCQCVDCSRITA